MGSPSIRRSPSCARRPRAQPISGRWTPRRESGQLTLGSCSPRTHRDVLPTAWSPDSSKLGVRGRDRTRPRSGSWMPTGRMRTRSRTAEQLPLSSAFAPSWSPDGSKILFADSAARRFDLMNRRRNKRPGSEDAAGRSVGDPNHRLDGSEPRLRPVSGSSSDQRRPRSARRSRQVPASSSDCPRLHRSPTNGSAASGATVARSLRLPRATSSSADLGLTIPSLHRRERCGTPITTRFRTRRPSSLRRPRAIPRLPTVSGSTLRRLDALDRHPRHVEQVAHLRPVAPLCGDGGGCSVIAGANSQSYQRNADSSSTIRADVEGDNDGGFDIGSLATAVVTGGSGGGGGGGSGSGGGSVPNLKVTWAATSASAQLRAPRTTSRSPSRTLVAQARSRPTSGSRCRRP